MATVLLQLLVSLSLFSATSTPQQPTRRPSPPVPAAPTNCSDELVAFSVCLPYISTHPNNQTHLPSSQCCHAIASSVTSQTAICLCYFIQQPLMLGFPLNSTRLMSLAKLCRENDCKNESKFSLKSLCAELPTLPPLRSITGPDGQPIQWTPIGEDLDGSPEQKSGPDNLSAPSTYPWATNNTKPAKPVQESVPTPSAANITRKPGSAPTSASTNITERPGPVATSGDGYFDYEPGNTSAANFDRQPGLLSSAFATCNSKWMSFIPQIIILAPLLSSCL